MVLTESKVSSDILKTMVEGKMRQSCPQYPMNIQVTVLVVFTVKLSNALIHLRCDF